MYHSTRLTVGAALWTPIDYQADGAPWGARLISLWQQVTFILRCLLVLHPAHGIAYRSHCGRLQCYIWEARCLSKNGCLLSELPHMKRTRSAIEVAHFISMFSEWQNRRNANLVSKNESFYDRGSTYPLKCFTNDGAPQSTKSSELQACFQKWRHCVLGSCDFSSGCSLIFGQVGFRVRYGALQVRSLRNIGVNLFREPPSSLFYPNDDSKESLLAKPRPTFFALHITLTQNMLHTSCREIIKTNGSFIPTAITGGPIK